VNHDILCRMSCKVQPDIIMIVIIIIIIIFISVAVPMYALHKSTQFNML